MKLLFALAFVALATAVPVPDVPQPVQLPAPVAPLVLPEQGFMAINIEPLIIAPEVADEFFRNLAPNPPVEDVHELAYVDIQPEPVHFVDVAENVDVEPKLAAENLILPVQFVDSEIPAFQPRAPLKSEEAEVAEEIVPEPVNFVDEAPELVVEEIVAEPVNFVDVAENAEAPVETKVAEVAPVETEVAEEIVPSPVNFVDVADNVGSAPLSDAVAEEIVPEPVNFVDVAENLESSFKNSEVAAEEIQPSPVHFVDGPVNFGDMSSMLR